MYNLGQIQGIIADGVENKILELVDNVQQVLAQRSHSCRGCCQLGSVALTLAVWMPTLDDRIGGWRTLWFGVGIRPQSTTRTCQFVGRMRLGC
jgi:hypothetical protein